MIALVLAALSAMAYGASDFSGAVASKRSNPMVIVVAAQAVSLLTLNAVLVIAPVSDRRLADLAWAALGGLCVAVALTCFYRALALGPMTTAAGTTALVGATIPVVVGLALGDQLSSGGLLGVAICVPACVLASMGATSARTGTVLSPRAHVVARRAAAATFRLSIVAGLGFAGFFIALSRVSGEGGLFPLLGARLASILVLCVVITAARGWEPLPGASIRPVVIAGVLDCAANATYLLAVARGQLAWVAAVSSLSPVGTVLLARIVLSERLAARQVAGLALSIIAVTLIATGS